VFSFFFSKLSRDIRYIISFGIEPLGTLISYQNILASLPYVK